MVHTTPKDVRYKIEITSITRPTETYTDFSSREEVLTFVANARSDRDENIVVTTQEVFQ